MDVPASPGAEGTAARLGLEGGEAANEGESAWICSLLGPPPQRLCARFTAHLFLCLHFLQRITNQYSVLGLIQDKMTSLASRDESLVGKCSAPN